MFFKKLDFVLVKLNMLVIGFFRLLLQLTGDGMSFDTLLETVFFEYINNMDYMSRSAHQKRAPKTFSWPLVALWSHYSQRHKSLF
jgi:hypothetical protein